MEIACGAVHAVFPMEDRSRVGEARRHAVQLANLAGFDEVAAGRVALVATELGTNLVKHASNGRLLIARRGLDDGFVDIEILSIDEGPGISDLDQCMRDGFSSSGTPGTGLGAVKRLADDFDIYSATPSGTLIVARVRNKPQRDDVVFRFGAVAIAAPGEVVSGDGWMIAIEGNTINTFVVDGLGHGPMAEEAAQTAIRHFKKNPFQDLALALQSGHDALRATRGAAVAVATIDANASLIHAVGAGNVIIRVVSGISDRTVLSQQGTIGLTIRKPAVVPIPWPDYALVAIHTDGVMQRWPSNAIAPLMQHDPSLAAALLVRDFCRGRDDATVLVIRRK